MNNGRLNWNVAVLALMAACLLVGCKKSVSENEEQAEGRYYEDAVISPNGGEYWNNGTPEEIIWSTDKISGSWVDMFIMYLGRDHEIQFASQIENTGTYRLDPADLHHSGNNLAIKIVDDVGNWDRSDEGFYNNWIY